MKYEFEDNMGTGCMIHARPTLDGDYMVRLNDAVVYVTQGQLLEMLHVMAKALDEEPQAEGGE